MKKVFITLIAVFLFIGCKKEKINQNISDVVKITLVSGNNQTAAIGYQLNDSVVVKVTVNGAPATNYEVQFIGSGCNEDLITNLHTKADGTVKYSWLMALDLGLQTLKAVAVKNNLRADSLTVNAMATNPVGMSRRSACVPNPDGSPQRILLLSTGRLIACFYSRTSIRYSDDNGISWHPLLGFGSGHSVSWIATTPQDEIFASADDGIFYSKDAGTSWTNITPPAFTNLGYVTDLAYTSGEKLIFSDGTSNRVYTSTDKGKTWVLATGLPGNSAFGNFVELPNGDLYLVSWTNILFKSTDVGKTWTAQSNKETEEVMSIYADKNGWFYKASMIPETYGYSTQIVFSKDNGTTFSNFFSYSPGAGAYITNMSFQPDGYFYYDELANSIARLYNNNSVADKFALTYQTFAAYIVAKNGHFLFGDGDGITIY